MKGQKLIIILVFALFVFGGCTPDIDKKGDVYYEIFTRSFNDSDGDGYGDLNGITEKLDYLDDLGVSGIWLMPIHSSPSYHKYDVADYYSVDPRYGTIEDLQNLITEAKDKNISIMLDLVINHTSNTHPWFKEFSSELSSGNFVKYHDYYVYSDSFKQGYTQLTGTEYYYNSMFSPNMPELNLDNPEVVTEIKNIIKFYIDLGIDGFRLDATYHYFEKETHKNVALLKELQDYALSLNPNFIMVGEAWSSRNEYVNYYDAGISTFDFALAGPTGELVTSIRTDNGSKFSNLVSNFNNTIKERNEDAVNSIFLSNHDMARAKGFFALEQDLKNAYSLLLMSPARPYLYYGDELEMRGSGRDENKRLGFNWDDKNITSRLKDADYDEYDQASLKEVKKDKESLYNHIKDVIEIRNNYDVFTNNSKTEVLELEKNLFNVLYYGENQKVLVVVNIGDNDVTFDVDNFSKITQKVGQVNSSAKNNSLTVTIEAGAIAIIE